MKRRDFSLWRQQRFIRKIQSGGSDAVGGAAAALVNPCFADALGRTVALSTLAQVLLDGANGVAQAQRLCTALDPRLLAASLAAVVVLLALLVGAVRRDSRRWLAALAIVAASYAPGWIHALALRADRPAAQRVLTGEVAAARTTYTNAMRSALASTPAVTCFVPEFRDTCVAFSGIYLAADVDLWPRRRCIGGEPSVVTVAVSACSPTRAEARIIP
jgi:hypothetical protein